MAALSISNSPHTLSAMSSRRAPLSSNPNAANSPYRAVAAAAAAKQKRSYATVQREEAYGQAPPAKKQMVQASHSLKTPTRQAAQAPEGRLFTRKTNSTLSNAFARKLEAARVKPVPQTQTKADKASEENLETIRQWQRHYRKVFPKFVFYFESVPEDVRIKYAKQVTALGAVSLQSYRIG
jgi:regulatory subunit for Cdc7p protein kinase